MALREKVYLARDNTIDLLLTADGSARELSTVTRMILAEDQAAAWAVDSQTYSNAFDWNTGTTGVVWLDLAVALAAEEVDAGEHTVRLVVYDPTNTNGIVWGTFTLEVSN